jgi:hypothetical protein
VYERSIIAESYNENDDDGESIEKEDVNDYAGLDKEVVSGLHGLTHINT